MVVRVPSHIRLTLVQIGALYPSAKGGPTDIRT